MAPAAEISKLLASRWLLAAVDIAARINQRCAVLGDPDVYDNAAFPWANQLSTRWQVIRAELDHVLERRAEISPVQEIIAGAGSITDDAGWKIFVLVAHGVPSPPNIASCPETWRLVRQIPGLRSAMFSIFEPGKRLAPHCGPYNGILRLHLGLLVPTPEHTGIRIGSQTRSWKEGEVLIFDDAHEHAAWNDSAELQVVLFVDFLNPLRFPASLVNRLLLRLAMFSPYVREGKESLRRWERRFHGEAAS